MTQRELRILQEQTHIDAAHEELRLLALKLDPETFWQGPIASSLGLQPFQPMSSGSTHIMQPQSMASANESCLA